MVYTKSINTKYAGVCKKKDGWYARITRSGKTNYYGPFKTDILASNEYNKLKNKTLSKNLKNNVIEKHVRKQFSQLDRNGIAAKQGWKCNFCKDVLAAHFEIDHLLPLQYGGANGFRNLQVLCLRCHRFKTQFLDNGDIKIFLSNLGSRSIERSDIETIQQKHLHKMLCIDSDDLIDLRE